MVIAKIRYIKKVIELENQKQALENQKSELYREIFELDDCILALKEQISWHNMGHFISAVAIAFLIYGHNFF